MTRTLTAALIVGVLAVLGGCAADRTAQSGPSPSPTPAPGRTVPSRVPGTLERPDGLNVRYLDADGSIRTLPVRDFPR